MSREKETLEQRIAKLKGSLLERVVADYRSQFGPQPAIDQFTRAGRDLTRLLSGTRRPPRIALACDV